MCGRIVDFLTVEEVERIYRVVGRTRLGVERPPNYNLKPTETIRAVRLDTDGRRELVALRWGLVPQWSGRIPSTCLFNARAETIATKRTWKRPFERQRALVPVSGFFEWQELPSGAKRPYFIHLADGEPMTCAGIWDSWNAGRTDAVESGAVATVAPSDEFTRFHDRQVVILRDQAEQDAWLDPGRSTDDLLDMLRPLPPGQLRFRPVGPAVSRRDYNGPDCIAEATEPPSIPPRIKRPRAQMSGENTAQTELF
jgi:putative SOS response-associated peptidase YedK